MDGRMRRLDVVPSQKSSEFGLVSNGNNDKTQKQCHAHTIHTAVPREIDGDSGERAWVEPTCCHINSAALCVQESALAVRAYESSLLVKMAGRVGRETLKHRRRNCTSLSPPTMDMAAGDSVSVTRRGKPVSVSSTCPASGNCACAPQSDASMTRLELNCCDCNNIGDKHRRSHGQTRDVQ
jgi:hypothetical protein